MPQRICAAFRIVHVLGAELTRVPAQRILVGIVIIGMRHDASSLVIIVESRESKRKRLRHPGNVALVRLTAIFPDVIEHGRRASYDLLDLGFECARDTVVTVRIPLIEVIERLPGIVTDPAISSARHSPRTLKTFHASISDRTEIAIGGEPKRLLHAYNVWACVALLDIRTCNLWPRRWCWPRRCNLACDGLCNCCAERLEIRIVKIAIGRAVNETNLDQDGGFGRSIQEGKITSIFCPTIFELACIADCLGDIRR